MLLKAISNPTQHTLGPLFMPSINSSEDKTPLYIHVGYPKTGTTFLQKRIFPQISNIHYLGKWAKNSQPHKIYCPMTNNDFSKFRDLFYNNTRDPALEKKFRDMIKKGKINVFSTEDFTSPENSNILSLFGKLKQICGEEIDVKVIMSVRNQSDMLYSYYRHLQKKARILSHVPMKMAMASAVRAFSQPNQTVSDLEKQEDLQKERYSVIHPHISQGLGQLNLDNYKYHKIAKEAMRVFGSYNVHILRQEALEKNPLPTIEKLVRFIQPQGLIQTMHNLKSQLTQKENVAKKTRQADKQKKAFNQGKLKKQIDKFYASSNQALRNIMRRLPSNQTILR